MSSLDGNRPHPAPWAHFPVYSPFLHPSRFPTEPFQLTLRSLLSTRLSTTTWDRSASPESKAAQRSLTRDLAQQIKAKMIEVEPRGFKYVVQVQLVENLGQGGRADMSCHWEERDAVVQEM